MVELIEAAGGSLTRVAAIAQVTWRDALRQKTLGVIVLLSATAVVGVLALRDFNFGRPEIKFVVELGRGAIGFFGVVLTVAMTTQLFFGELEQRTLQPVLARPVSRAEFVVGKLVGVMALTAVFCAAMTGWLMLIVWRREAALRQDFRDSAENVRYLWLAAGGLLLWFKLAVLGSFTLLVASYARGTLFTLTTGLLVGAACHLHALARHAAQPVALLLHWLLPDFTEFVPADDASLLGHSVARLGIYALGYVMAGSALAAFSFKRREI